MKRPKSEEEKARTPLSDELAEHVQTPAALETTIKAVMLYHRMDRRDAVCALRDYFQVQVAKHMDLMAKGLDDDFLRLKAQIKADSETA